MEARSGMGGRGRRVRVVLGNVVEMGYFGVNC